MLRPERVKNFTHKNMVQCNCRDPLAKTNAVFSKSQLKVNFEKKNPVLPIEKFLFLVLARDTIMLQHLLSIIHSIICQVVIYGRLKTKENFKLLALKVVAVAYERWSLTRGSKYSNLTWKLLVCWKTGR